MNETGKAVLLVNLLVLFSNFAQADGLLREVGQAVPTVGRAVIMYPISFYGQVVDQFNQPVTNADVEIGINKFSLSSKSLFGRTDRIHCTTDSIGCFQLHDRGYNLSIDKITARGYEYTYEWNTNNSFDYSSEVNRYKPNKAKPEIFRLRKKLRPEVFLDWTPSLKMSLPASCSGCTNGYDLIQQYQIKDLRRLVLNYHPVVPDILMTATQNPKAGQWTVTFLSGSLNGGIIVTNHLLYEVPESGYQPAFTLTLTNDFRTENVVRFYLKSREPAVYTRVDLKYFYVAADGFTVTGDAWMNPYGDRDMEMATDLPSGLYVRLSKEVDEAFWFGKRPLRPDLPKLIEEANGK